MGAVAPINTPWNRTWTRISQESLASQFLLAIPTGKWTRGRWRTRWSDYISELVWSQSWCGNYLKLLKTVMHFQSSWGCCPRLSPEEERVWKWTKELFRKPRDVAEEPDYCIIFIKPSSTLQIFKRDLDSVQNKRTFPFEWKWSIPTDVHEQNHLSQTEITRAPTFKKCFTQKLNT